MEIGSSLRKFQKQSIVVVEIGPIPQKNNSTSIRGV